MIAMAYTCKLQAHGHLRCTPSGDREARLRVDDDGVHVQVELCTHTHAQSHTHSHTCVTNDQACSGTHQVLCYSSRFVAGGAPKNSPSCAF